MSFMLKKKRYKFQVDLCLEELNEVVYSKAILFAKVRQLEGGSFTDVSKRMEVQNHRVRYSAKFLFPCKMNANASSGVLETCNCRISIRMEEKGGRHFRKLGFTDINLAEYAGAGPSTQRYILQPYDHRHRLDNSILTVSLNITLREGDTIFQRPLTRQQPISLPGEDSADVDPIIQTPSASATAAALTAASSSQSLVIGSTATTTTATNSLTIPTSADCLAKSSGGDSPTHSDRTGADLDAGATDANVDAGGTDADLSHTRNSSTTSHASQASAGYSSQNSQVGPGGGVGGGGGGGPGGEGGGGSHSRQSSSGESSSHGRNLSQGSSDTGFFGGSLEKEKRRKQQKLDEGRIDAEMVINELMEGVDLDKEAHEDAESSGLQLFVGKDGSVTFDKNSTSRRDFQPVVIRGPR